MRKGHVYMYYGMGKGKTTLAIGQGMRAVSEGMSVVMVQFLDYNNNKENLILKRLEPDFRVFRFEKNRDKIEPEDHGEIKNEVKTSLNFSKKILETGECEMLILDGVLNAIKDGYIEECELIEALERRSGYMDVIITGTDKCLGIVNHADYIFSINIEKSIDAYQTF